MLRLIRVAFLALLFLSTSVYADNDDFFINKIHLQLNAQKWVTTQTALVSVSINAAVQTQGIDKVTASVQEHLKKISATGTWNITSLQRSEEKSGLESVQMRAEARLPQNELSDLRDKAKLISTPGEAFKIESIVFKPSDEDVRSAETDLRQDIYTQAKAEIDRLNKVYPEQKFYIHAINFISPPMPMAMSMMQMRAEGPPMRQGGQSMSMSSSSLDVGNKREIIADVVIGSLADITRKGLPPNL